MPTQVEDAEILSKFQDERTRNEAFNLLLNKYQQKIYWHIRRMVIDHDDADDLVQDVFIKIWKNLAGFRNDAQLYTWMCRTNCQKHWPILHILMVMPPSANCRRRC